MGLLNRGFQFPQKISFDEDTLTLFYGKLIAEPLERGFGTTIGNPLRRILLSSIEGAAVTSVRISNVLHEFSSVEGLKEDVVDILLNIKKLRFRLYTEGEKIVRINLSGPKEITGADIQVVAGVEIMNKDQYIATIENNSAIEVEMRVRKGKGYVSAEFNKELNKDEGLPIDTLAIDSVFSPVKKVNFQVEKTRVGKQTDYDRLIMEIWTDGSISPEKAVSDAAHILIDHLDLFIFCEDLIVPEEVAASPSVIANPSTNEHLMKNIDELELSVRAYNCLKNANIKNIAELVQKTEYEMLKTKNFGRKSLNEIKELLNSMGLHFGMRINLNELGSSL